MFLYPSNLSLVPARLGTPHKAIQIQMAVGFLFRFNHYLYAVWHYPHLLVVPSRHVWHPYKRYPTLFFISHLQPLSRNSRAFGNRM
jgi:hypothetical protein